MLKQECIRPQVPQSLDAAKRAIAAFIDDYDNRRLHSALGYVTPADKLAGKEEEIFSMRDKRIEQARLERAQRRRGLCVIEAGTSSSTEPRPEASLLLPIAHTEGRAVRAG